jgi:hypothetical protein
MMTEAEAALEGKTVLLVEDESLVSMLAEEILIDAGCEVILAMRLDRALEVAKSAEIDCALLDVNLGNGATSFRSSSSAATAPMVSTARLPRRRSSRSPIAPTCCCPRLKTAWRAHSQSQGSWVVVVRSRSGLRQARQKLSRLRILGREPWLTTRRR